MSRRFGVIFFHDGTSCEIERLVPCEFGGAPKVAEKTPRRTGGSVPSKMLVARGHLSQMAAKLVVDDVRTIDEQPELDEGIFVVPCADEFQRLALHLTFVDSGDGHVLPVVCVRLTMQIFLELGFCALEVGRVGSMFARSRRTHWGSHAVPLLAGGVIDDGERSICP